MPIRFLLVLQHLLMCVCLMSACADGDDSGSADAGSARSDESSDNLLVKTASGTLRGERTGSSRAFLGIPYGAPPIAELRWRAPEPAASWIGERDATVLPPICPQLGFGAEDCLYLNVWAPEAKQGDAPRPTMVWLHGGAFVAGHANLYDGSTLAANGDVVVVALNYRLGALGFLAHPALTADPGGRGSSGNYGLEDQLLALRWVKDNIRAFGGDPDNVTLFGESAGSACTCALLGTPAAQDLVQRAIMQSGACLGFESSLEDAEVRGETTVASLGCTGPDTLACLRAKSATQIVTMSSDLIGSLTQQRWRPIVDGVVIPEIAEIRPVMVPIIVGTNRNEGGQFGLLAATDALYKSRVAGYYPNPDDAQRVLDAYSATKLGSPAAAFSALVTDSLFVCPSRRLARAAAAAGVKTWVYSFAYGNAFHADDVPFVFGLADANSGEQEVAGAMLSAWAAFAHNADPNDGSLPSWPAYDAANDQHMIFDAPPAIGTGLKAAECDLLDQLPALHF